MHALLFLFRAAVTMLKALEASILQSSTHSSCIGIMLQVTDKSFFLNEGLPTDL